MNFYNDNDKFASKWIRALIQAGLIPNGQVDDRSITEIKPEDLDGFTQCHFFAGIAGWPRALELAGWNPNEPVWSASLPCQPFSCAGQQKGADDERHLWPIFFNLVKECRPTTIFGEQVASKDGREWLSGVQTDLETLEYSCAAADLPAASVGSPHKRSRLFWVADSQRNGGRSNQQRRQEKERTANFWSNSISIPCADEKWRRVPGQRVDNASSTRPEPKGEESKSETWDQTQLCGFESRRKDDTAQHHLEIEPALFPLADGFSNRVGTLRGAGNAIVSQVAAEFVAAFMEITGTYPNWK